MNYLDPARLRDLAFLQDPARLRDLALLQDPACIHDPTCREESNPHSGSNLITDTSLFE